MLKPVFIPIILKVFTFDRMVTLISLCISALSILIAFFTVVYQIKHNNSFEKEKIRLEVYSNFVAYCQKKASGASTPNDDFELMKLYSKLAIISDHELNLQTELLYHSLFSNPHSSETLDLLNKEMQEMWLRLKNFNRRRGMYFPRY